nr:MAG TPA: hypothetical protein [Caudoviricetes sp.]
MNVATCSATGPRSAAATNSDVDNSTDLLGAHHKPSQLITKPRHRPAFSVIPVGMHSQKAGCDPRDQSSGSSRS